MRITKDNIDEFINGSVIYCSNMGITGIDYIPDGITELYCGDNKLTSLPELPTGLKSLYCYANKLTSLPKLPTSLINLSSFKNNLPYKVTIDNIKEHNKLVKRKEILSKICG